MDILTRMRNTTRADLEGITGDFSDLPTPVYVSRRPKDMIRVVEGADDLVHPNAGRVSTNAGMSLSQDWTGEDTPINDGPVDARSEGQIRYMDNLIDWITEKDAKLGADARAYTDRMTKNGRWTRNEGSVKGTISVWIDRLKAKNTELKAIEAAAPKLPTGDADASFQAIPNGYYAVRDAGSNDIHFFRVSRFRDGGIKVQEQASDTLHPVRRGGRRTAILNAILAVGWRASQELYGQTIGRCGRCNRTLTDSTSRDRGFGDDCWGKL